jgi:hypothetical protein
MHYRRQESRHPSGTAIAWLSADLDLAELCQDWEIVAADPDRVLEFLGYCDTQQLNDDERFTLMSLIIASYDEALSGAEDRGLQDQIIARLNFCSSHVEPRYFLPRPRSTSCLVIIMRWISLVPSPMHISMASRK